MREFLIRGGVIAAFVLSVLALSTAASFYGAGANKQATHIIVPQGASLRQVAHILAQAEIVHSPRLFTAAGRVLGFASQIKAGEYALPPYASMAHIFTKLQNGTVVLYAVTIAEGLTSRQINAQLAAHDFLVGTAAIAAEGSLLPETYFVPRGTPRLALLARMQKAHTDLLNTLWQNRQADLPFATAQQAVILASIVEKETARADERGQVARVFINRMRRNMRLQSDPTIIYGITKQGRLGRALTKSDIARTTPYNTYRIDGLPPTPIANVGRAALQAVLHPATSTALYFVADGKGGHVFAKTLAAHNRNVRRYRLYSSDSHNAPKAQKEKE